MKSLFPALVASLLLAPVAAATHTGCHNHPPQEGIAHPAKPGHYLMLVASDTAKIGEWAESNGIGGLQTSICSVGSTWVYQADRPSSILP